VKGKILFTYPKREENNSSAFKSATGGFERDIPIVPDRVGAGCV